MNKNPSYKDKKNNKANIYDEYTFNKDIELAQTLLSATGQKDWDKRQQMLAKLSLYLQNMDQTTVLVKSFDRLSACLLIQFSDLRSGVYKEVHRLINNLAEYLGPDFHSTSEKMITSEGQLKQLKSGNKIVAELAHECIFNLVKQSQPAKCIPHFISEFISKSGNVRAKLSEYISEIVSNYPDNIVQKHSNNLQVGIQHSLNDANKEAREHGKVAFCEFCQHFPDASRKILMNIDPITRKHVEAYALQNKPDRSDRKIPQKSYNDLDQIKKPRSNYVRSSSQIKKEEKSPIRRNRTYADDENSVKTDTKKRNMEVKGNNPDRPPKLPQKNDKSKLNVDVSGRAKNKYQDDDKESVQSTKSRARRVQSAGLKNQEVANVRDRSSDKKSNKKTGFASSLLNKKLGSNDNDENSLFHANNLNQASQLSSNQKEEKSKCNFYDDHQIEDLEYLVDNTTSSNWATRAHSFDKICEWFNENDIASNSSDGIRNDILNKLVQGVAVCLNDNNPKCVESSFRALNTVFPRQKENAYLKKEIENFIRKSLTYLVDKKESLSQQADLLFTMMLKYWSPKDVQNGIMKQYHEFSSIIIQHKAIEKINFILNDDIRNEISILFTPIVVKSLLPKISYIFNLKTTKNKPRVEAMIIDIIKTLLKGNHSASMESYRIMDPNFQKSIKDWCYNYDNELLMILEGQQDNFDFKNTFKVDSNKNIPPNYKQTGDFNKQLTGTFGAKEPYEMQYNYNQNRNQNDKQSNYTDDQSANQQESENSHSQDNHFEEVNDSESNSQSDSKSNRNSNYGQPPQIHFKTYEDIITEEQRNKRDPNLLTFNEKDQLNIEAAKIKPLGIGKKKTQQNFYDPYKEEYEKLQGKSQQTKESNLTSGSSNPQNKTSQVTSMTKVPTKDSQVSLRMSKNTGVIIESINIDNHSISMNKSSNVPNNLLNTKSSRKSFTKSATTPKNMDYDSGLLSTEQKNSVVLKESIETGYYNKRDKSIDMSKSNEVVNNKKKELPSLKKEFNPYDKFKSDNIADLTNKEINRLLEKLRTNIRENFKMKKMRELKVILQNGYPLLVACLPKLFNTDLYKSVIKDILDTFSYWNICNEAICLLIRELINLFFEYPKDLMLLEDVVDIFIQIPFKAELFKQITYQIDVADIPTQPLQIKVFQSLIAIGSDTKIKNSEIRRPFMPCLGTLVASMTKHINNNIAEVRKSVVFFQVEQQFFLKDSEYQEVMYNFEPSHQKLVSVYIQRRNTQETISNQN